MSTYDLETTIQLPDEDDVDVLIEFEVDSWGSPATPASWNYPGDPGDGPEFGITKVTRLDNGEDITRTIVDLPSAWAEKIGDIVLQCIYEIDQDRGYGYDDF